jgi:hypothetical protein
LLELESERRERLDKVMRTKGGYERGNEGKKENDGNENENEVRVRRDCEDARGGYRGAEGGCSGGGVVGDGLDGGVEGDGSAKVGVVLVEDRVPGLEEVGCE